MTSLTHARRFDNASGKLFLLAFISAKLRFIPIPYAQTILNLFSLSTYLIGYVLWLVACHFHPDHAPKPAVWYGFGQIKNQNRLAAALGFVGIGLCIAAIFFPILLIPGSLIFAVSNICWSLAEYHRRQNPPPFDKHYSAEQQNYYLSYAILSSIVSVVSAVTLTLTFIFPPIGVAAIFISIISFSLTVAAFYFLLNKAPRQNSTRTPPAISEEPSSYAQMSPKLSTDNLLAQNATQPGILPSESEPTQESTPIPRPEYPQESSVSSYDSSTSSNSNLRFMNPTNTLRETEAPQERNVLPQNDGVNYYHDPALTTALTNMTERRTSNLI